MSWKMTFFQRSVPAVMLGMNVLTDLINGQLALSSPHVLDKVYFKKVPS